MREEGQKASFRSVAQTLTRNLQKINLGKRWIDSLKEQHEQKMMASVVLPEDSEPPGPPKTEKEEFVDQIREAVFNDEEGIDYLDILHHVVSDMHDKQKKTTMKKGQRGSLWHDKFL